MKQEYIRSLIDHFNNGRLTTAEQKDLESLIESGIINLDQLESSTRLMERLDQMKVPTPDSHLDDRFYNMLAMEKQRQRRWVWAMPRFADSWVSRFAIGACMLVAGLLAGYLLRPADNSEQNIQALTREVIDLREMMMLSLLEKESATERLKAVSLTSEMKTASTRVTGALIQTLNNDENVNVRLAALDALRPYTGDSAVREEIIRSIARQTSPLVQLALADLMVHLQLKSSVKELEKIIGSDRTPEEVRVRIKENIKILI